jgi:hypothetical protein
LEAVELDPGYAMAYVKQATVMLLGFLQEELVAAWWPERAAPISPEFRKHINALQDGEGLNVRPARGIGKESGI